MKDRIVRYGLLIFLFVAGLQLSAVAVDHEVLRFVTKPLLMPLLAAIVYSGGHLPKKGYIVAGLFFSFLGDTFLLLESRQPLFFIFGLVAFLITHICYIIYFLRVYPQKGPLIFNQPYLLLIIIAYGAGLVWWLYPSLGALRLPVMVYAFTICTMLAASIQLYPSIRRHTGWLFISGAMLFVVSDSLLAINKFSHPFTAAAFFIMLTYCAAQYFIVRGVLMQRPSDHGLTS